MSILKTIAKGLLKGPLLFYRYMISPFIPAACRHLPTCSQYASDAIDLNGAWKGGWLTVSRVLRCHPWGSQGLDPAPDLGDEHQPIYLSWRYGRWTGRHITQTFNDKGADQQKCKSCDH